MICTHAQRQTCHLCTGVVGAGRFHIHHSAVWLASHTLHTRDSDCTSYHPVEGEESGGERRGERKGGERVLLS